MASMSALEMLAPELQLQILFNAATLNDLYALIQASPRLYQVYVLNKEVLLSAVARQQFHPAVMPDALFIMVISRLRRPLSRDTAIKLCKIYPSELDNGLTFPISTSVALCNLASNLRFFIEDYARNTLPIMEGLGQSLEIDVLSEYTPENPVPYSKLSGSEVGRLQRAFCRFEIYRHLFARCSPELGHDSRTCLNNPSMTPAEQASLFLEKFPDFQLTEINCIRDYLYRRLRGICRQVEDQAFDTLAPEDLTFEDYESAEWNSGLYLFTDNGKDRQKDHIEHLMSLGLAYIRLVFESTGPEQKNLFIRHHPHSVVRHLETTFITEALQRLGRNPAGRDTSLAKTDPPFVYNIDADAELDIPDAWQWAYPCGPPFKLSDDDSKGLRDWGFVFWDRNRLRESGILERR